MLTKIALSVALVLATASAAFAAAQDSGSPAELEDRDATTKPPPHALVTLPPHGLVTPAHVEWDWHRTVGIDINDKIAYRLDITVGANGTGEAIAGIDVTRPSNFPPYYCEVNTADVWRGPIIFHGSSMTFPAGSENVVNTCNPALSGVFPRNAVTFQWQLTECGPRARVYCSKPQQALGIIMPFFLGQYNDVFLVKTRF